LKIAPVITDLCLDGNCKGAIPSQHDFGAHSGKRPRNYFVDKIFRDLKEDGVVDLDEKLNVELFTVAPEVENTCVDFISSGGLGAVGNCFAKSCIIVRATEKRTAPAVEGGKHPA